MTGIAVVPYRNVPHKLVDLGIKCDSGEMPHPIEGETADSYFVGAASVVTDEIEQVGLFALFLFKGQLGIILAPIDPEEPACWISCDLDEVDVGAEGRAGIIVRRPALITIDGPNFGLRLREVVQFFPNGKLLQARRSGKLLSELTRAGG